MHRARVKVRKHATARRDGRRMEPRAILNLDIQTNIRHPLVTFSCLISPEPHVHWPDPSMTSSIENEGKAGEEKEIQVELEGKRWFSVVVGTSSFAALAYCQ